MKQYRLHLLSGAFFLALLFNKFDPKFGFSELSAFGEDYWLPKVSALDSSAVYHKPNSTGYDGQFYAQIALDPSMTDPLYEEAIDHPSYRARRILLPTLSYLVGLGNPKAILQAHSLLNVAFLLACSLLLLRWIPAGSLENFARWFFCVFSLGALESVRYSLSDLPSLTLALATIALLEKARPKWAILSNTLSIMTKETGVLNAFVFLCPNSPAEPADRFANRLFRFMAACGIAALSFGLWMLFVSYRFPITVNASSNIVLPFTGIVDGIAEALRNWSEEGPSDRYGFRLLAIAGLLFQFASLAFAPHPASRIWIMGIVYGVLFLCLGDAVWHGYWAACRIALPLTFAFNILYRPTNKALFWIGLVGSNLVFVHGIIRWL